MIHDKDIVRDIFYRVKEVLGPEFKGEIAIRLEQEEKKVRMDWGGTEPYIRKIPDRDSVKSVVLEKIRSGSPVSKVSKDTGICKSKIYQLLRMK